MQTILVDENFNPKICDFGFATFNTGKLNESLGTLNYAAPEILLHRPYDGFKADIFSLGVVLLTLVSCKIGFQEASKRDPYYRLIMTKHYGQYWNVVSSQIGEVSEDLKKLYNKMVSFRPQERPTIEEILNDDWMKEINDLTKEDYDQLENTIREEFLEREKIVNEELKKKMQTDDKSNSDMDSTREIEEDEKEYFDLSLKPQYAQTGIGMNNYIKINGNLNPAKFMNILINKIKNQFAKDCSLEQSKKALKFIITFEEEELKEEEIPKELEEELAQLGLEENDENEDDDLKKKDCVIQVKMFESINGGHLLRFVKKSGELDDYYKNLDKITSLVKKLL